ncbi:hypothetical protein CYMTET_2793 [Cymbomonas tetramitiformis]|uniref:Uncharacterized protein n=1 Tax=Cymbomonas tetramitiformis TaxID=36881 RepID=A0AAE0LLG4_9CHLO|nr:hypothetical protein CYMTET_2793 [Cymbomonas tetramitiformis]
MEPPMAHPSHIVIFDDAELLRQVEPFFDELGCMILGRYFHAHFAADRGLQANLLVYVCSAAHAEGDR